ncbi:MULTISPECIES: hypothetical protein [Kitasatospora]|uniref:Integral membrane protein n=1 Tax=Kitasatospora setae (strain ATCC 33774 / DSM 43861 / JCM 3304 / KCC A-0304 / NBRC 14216 / KM-6054) TaxID=452652 RepID=E4N478_KITSK|nr:MULTISPECIES: hypothetical protein [Kitasatospora]BAJ26009.1 hypothetical protein KSE_01580 [Kitasatospora setae KM-6054]
MSEYREPPRWPLTVLRAGAALTALLALLMPFLAGGFLQGYYPLLDAHKQTAMALSTVSLLTAAAGLLLWRLSRGPSGPAVQYGVLTLLCVVQYAFGDERILLLHVPLGVGVFVMAEKSVVEAFKVKLGAGAGAGAGAGDKAGAKPADAPDDEPAAAAAGAE